MVTDNRAALGWGVVLVTLGGVLLLRNLGLWPAGVGVFPVLLIVVGGLLLTGGLTRGGDRYALEPASLPLDGAASARVKLAYGAGTLRLGAAAGAGLLHEGTFVGGVRHEIKRSGEHLDVTLGPAGDVTRWIGMSRPLDWNVQLSDSVPVDLEVTTGASRVHLDLTHLQVRSLKLETGASDIDVTLPAHGRCHVDIDAAAADVSVFVPEGVAASIKTSSALASVVINPSRFPRSNGLHRSPDYDSAPDRAEIEIDGALASFSVQ